MYPSSSSGSGYRKSSNYKGGYKKKYNNKRSRTGADIVVVPQANAIPMPMMAGTYATSGKWLRNGPGWVERKSYEQEMALSQALPATTSGVGATMSAICAANAESYTGIEEGTSANQRIGRKVTIAQWRTRMMINCEATSGTSQKAVAVRVIHFIDKQWNGGTDDTTTLLSKLLDTSVIDMTGTNGATGNAALVMANLDNVDRFTILKDQVKLLNPQGAVASTHGCLLFKCNYKFKDGLQIEWSGTTGAATAIRSNNLFVAVLASCDNTTATANAWTISTQGCSRVRYVDK